MDKESFCVNRHFLHFLSKMNFKPFFFGFLVTLACGKEQKEQEFIHSRLPNAIAVVGRSFQYFLSPQVDLPSTLKVCFVFTVVLGLGLGFTLFSKK